MNQMEIKGIIKDSMDVLAFIYKIDIYEHRKSNSNEVLQVSKFEKNRVLRIIEFLNRETLITCLKMSDGSYKNIKCDNEGIKLIEYPNQHLNNLNIKVVFNIDSLFKLNSESIFKTDSIVKVTAFG